MTDAIAETGRDAGLGVLEHAVTVEADLERARVFFRAFRVSEPGLGLCSAVAAAFMHSTYLYEHDTEFPDVTKGLQEALFTLGLAYLRKLAAVDSYKRTASLTAGALSKEVAEVAYALEHWSANQGWVLENGALGRTFANSKTPDRVYERLLRQVVGVLCLANEEALADHILKDLLSEVHRNRSSTVTDPKTILQVAIAPINAEYSYEREGPDHETVFKAIVTDTRGRRGTGIGRSKKHASQNAALDFLKRHIPQAVSIRALKPTLRPTPVAIPEPRAHAIAVGDLQKLFGLTASATPLLSQALIHSSWAYEHPIEMGKYHQLDNQVLAFVGGEAAVYEDALAMTRRAAANPPAEFAFRGLANEGYNGLFRRADVGPGLLLGTGQASEVTAEMGATAFQAIIGAIFVAKGFPNRMEPSWPTAWRAMWQIIASPAPRPSDPTTLLQEAASAMRLQTDYEFRRSGPDHASQYHAVLVLDSPTLRIRTRVTGSPASRKTSAKHEAAATVLQTLDHLAEPAQTQELANATASELKLARFLLAHQAALLATAPVPLQLWTTNRFFGLHLAAKPQQLIAWANCADKILESRDTLKTSEARLEESFRAVLQPSNSLRTFLARTLEALEQISAPEDLTQDHLDQLARLSGVYRSIGGEDPDTDLCELANDWSVLYPGRLAAPVMPVVRLTGRERAVLDAALDAVLRPGAHASVELTSTKPLRLRIITATGPPPRATSIADTSAMWSGVTSTALLSPVEHGIEVTITATESQGEPGPIAAAVLAALQPRPEPYQASLADVLHDLKNQVVAARHAVTQPAETATAKLEQQLDARRHLDRAHSMVLQLRAATSMLEQANDDNVSVELGTFLRDYARAAFGWLPNNIALSTPGAPHPAYVALDARALTALLDNLVKNASEAMPRGGSIELAWAADSYEAIIEVADDGPGLPENIALAFATGQRIHSTKPGGNGLGLLGARSLVRRVGGQLTAAPVPSGTAWVITLPIVARNSEDS